MEVLITKGSSSGATLSLALRSKGEAGQPSYLMIQAIAVHFRNPPLHPSQTLKSNPKHCNLHVFCDFCMEQSLLATCRKLRKYQCFCSVLSKKHCTVNIVVFATRSKQHRKYRGFGLPRRKKKVFTVFSLLQESQE